jgi:hypothetical protein
MTRAGGVSRYARKESRREATKNRRDGPAESVGAQAGETSERDGPWSRHLPDGTARPANVEGNKRNLTRGVRRWLSGARTNAPRAGHGGPVTTVMVAGPRRARPRQTIRALKRAPAIWERCGRRVKERKLASEASADGSGCQQQTAAAGKPTGPDDRPGLVPESTGEPQECPGRLGARRPGGPPELVGIL